MVVKLKNGTYQYIELSGHNVVFDENKNQLIIKHLLKDEVYELNEEWLNSKVNDFIDNKSILLKLL